LPCPICQTLFRHVILLLAKTLTTIGVIKIATAAYDKEELELQDGTVVTLRPLNITNLRRFSKALRELNEARDNKPEDENAEQSEEREVDGMIRLAGICLERELKDKVTEDTKDTKEADEVWREYLEDSLDMPTIDKVLEVCGGVTKPDPNLLAAALEMAQRGQTEDGKTSTS
jgi:hypothetical protein